MIKTNFKLHRDRAQKMKALIAKGMTMRAACKKLGIAPSLYYVSLSKLKRTKPTTKKAVTKTKKRIRSVNTGITNSYETQVERMQQLFLGIKDLLNKVLH